MFGEASDGFFFFQAEDGIRDRTVTGVQTCALPILVLDHPVDRGTVHHRVVAQDRHAEDEIGRASCRERGWIPVMAGVLINETARDYQWRVSVARPLTHSGHQDDMRVSV